MPKVRKRLALAQRLKAAATQSGLSGAEIARQLGVRPLILYRWWYGDRGPRADHLVAYARIVGQPVAYFYESEEEIEQQAREMAEVLVQWARSLLDRQKPELIGDGEASGLAAPPR